MPECVKFVVEIDSGNEAIVNRPEYSIAKILNQIATKVSDTRRCGPIHDENGNSIGYWGFTD